MGNPLSQKEHIFDMQEILSMVDQTEQPQLSYRVTQNKAKQLPKKRIVRRVSKNIDLPAKESKSSSASASVPVSPSKQDKEASMRGWKALGRRATLARINEIKTTQKTNADLRTARSEDRFKTVSTGQEKIIRNSENSLKISLEQLRETMIDENEQQMDLFQSSLSRQLFVINKLQFRGKRLMKAHPARLNFLLNPSGRKPDG